MRLIDLLNETLYGQRVTVEFECGIIAGTPQVLLKTLDVDVASVEIRSISAIDNVLKVVAEG
jgi:hypothetical protein